MTVTMEMAREMETEMAGETETGMDKEMGMEIPIGITEVLCLLPVNVLTMTLCSVNHSTLKELKELS
ncbi:hypothetical protein Tco_0075858, partial [Tanacetum coccineum]